MPLWSLPHLGKGQYIKMFLPHQILWSCAFCALSSYSKWFYVLNYQIIVLHLYIFNYIRSGSRKFKNVIIYSEWSEPHADYWKQTQNFIFMVPFLLHLFHLNCMRSKATQNKGETVEESKLDTHKSMVTILDEHSALPALPSTLVWSNFSSSIILTCF